MHYGNIKEEELKNKVAQDYFYLLDCTKIIGNIDFCVALHNSQPKLFEHPPLLWAEAKKGIADIYKSISQLILTIGKVRTFDKLSTTPAFLGAFDAEKIAFVPYSEIMDIFYQNDFNWNVTPSNHTTKEFLQVLVKVKNILNTQALIFYFGKNKNDTELKNFIDENFVAGKHDVNKIRIDKNNFMVIYNNWLTAVKPSIEVNWGLAKKSGIIDGDFYLADLLSDENTTLKDKLFVLLKTNAYHLDRKIDEAGFFNSKTVFFKHKDQTIHNQFWNIYERPPKEEYWDYIIARRDLLVPQDVRERKGSFFTPQIWVELSQKYLADTLGEDWQDEYYIWDCACGTGNLLVGLTNKYNIWASTLDKQDIDVIHDRIQNGANLLENHVFQFDFLNDSFDKLPKNLQEVIKNPEKRKKLVIYINPPYAEATTAKTVTGTGENKAGVSKGSKVSEYYNAKIGNASNEMFALFMARIYDKIPDAKLTLFSTLKFVQGTNFIKFRDFFRAKFLGAFIVRADTFDNVKGSFPIGFTIWDLSIKDKINQIVCDVIANNGTKESTKTFYGELPESINKWIKIFDNGSNIHFGYMGNPAPDFQNNKFLNVENLKGTRHVNYFAFTKNNVIMGSIYFAVRQVTEATWLNDRDQFLFPNDGWKTDREFQNDCLTYMLFHGQNRVTTKESTNHFIPFTEQEIEAGERFESNFMTDFIKGKLKPDEKTNLFGIAETLRTTPLVFSAEAKTVFDAGRELWQYYHQSIKNINTFLNTKPNANASLYDIREYFQGRNATTGRMNNKSDDTTYNELIDNLREKLKILAKKIEIKVYEYGFLKA